MTEDQYYIAKLDELAKEISQKNDQGQYKYVTFIKKERGYGFNLVKRQGPANEEILINLSASWPRSSKQCYLSVCLELDKLELLYSKVVPSWLAALLVVKNIAKPQLSYKEKKIKR